MYIKKKTFIDLFFRVEVSKLLGKVEMLSVPYVTENTRVHILLPVYTHEKEDAFHFLKQYKQICIDKKEKTMLMLVSLIMLKFTSSYLKTFKCLGFAI